MTCIIPSCEEIDVFTLECAVRFPEEFAKSLFADPVLTKLVITAVYFCEINRIGTLPPAVV